MANELTIRLSISYATGGQTLYSESFTATQTKSARALETGVLNLANTSAVQLALPSGNPRYVLIQNLETTTTKIVHVHTKNTTADGDERLASIPAGGILLYPVGVADGEADDAAGGAALIYVHTEDANTNIKYTVLGA